MKKTPFQTAGDLSRFLKTRVSLRSILIPALATLPILRPSGAEGQPAPALALPLPEIVVTASRTERDLLSIPASVTVLEADELRRTPGLSLPDLLRSQPGLQISDTLGNGRTATVDLRGFGETAQNNTLVLVNGRRMNNSDTGEVDWTQLGLLDVERVEILRGGASVLYGDKAVGGVVNLLTRTSPKKLQFISQTSLGSFESFQQSLSLSGTSGPIGFGLRGSYSDSKGYRANNFLRNKTTGIDLRFFEQRPFSLELQFGAKEDRYGMPGYTRRGADPQSAQNPRDFGETNTLFLVAVPKLRWDESNSLELPIHLTRTDYAAHFVSWGSRLRWQVRELALRPNWDQHFDLGPFQNHLKVGIDYQLSDRSSRDDPWNPERVRRNDQRHETGFFLNDSVTLLPERLFWDAGYRFTYVNFDYDSIQRSRSFPIHSAQTGLTFRYRPGSKAFMSLDRSFRNMLMTGELSNTEILPPQTSWQTQAGILHAFHPKFSAGLTGFRIDTSDEIFYDPRAIGGLFPGANSNYPKTRRIGLETSLLFDPLKTLHCFANYRLLDPRLTTGRYDGKQIPMVARHSAQAGIRWNPLQRWEWNTRFRWIHHQYSISDWNNQRRDWLGSDFFVTDSRVSFQAFEWLKLYAGVNNLFDRQYSESGTFSSAINDAVLYPNPGRNWTAGISVTREF
jgi:iron complex outermembrane receptor protein